MRELRDLEQLGRREIFVVTEEFKQELQDEYRKVEILMSYEELVIKADNMEEILKAWDKNQATAERLDECYGDNGETYIFGQALGGRKSAHTKTTKTLFKEIDRAFGQNQRTSIAVYTMLQHGRIQRTVEGLKKYEKQQNCLAEAGLL